MSDDQKKKSLGAQWGQAPVDSKRVAYRSPIHSVLRGFEGGIDTGQTNPDDGKSSEGAEFEL